MVCFLNLWFKSVVKIQVKIHVELVIRYPHDKPADMLLLPKVIGSYMLQLGNSQLTNN